MTGGKTPSDDGLATKETVGLNADALAPAASDPRPRWMRWALIVSLALNLLILGVVGGAIARIGHGMPMGPVADVGFGPFTEALTPEDRRSLRDAFMAKAPNMREMRSEARSDLAALITALRAETWDAAGVGAALERQRTRTVERIAVGQQLLLDRMSAMSVGARHAFADRLEDMTRRGPLRQPKGG